MQPRDHFWSRVSRADMIVGLAMAAATIGGGVMQYGFNKPVPWWAFVVTMLVAAIAFLRGELVYQARLFVQSCVAAQVAGQPAPDDPVAADRKSLLDRGQALMDEQIPTGPHPYHVWQGKVRAWAGDAYQFLVARGTPDDAAIAEGVSDFLMQTRAQTHIITEIGRVRQALFRQQYRTQQQTTASPRQ